MNQGAEQQDRRAGAMGFLKILKDHLVADKARFRAFLLILAVGTVFWAKPLGLLLWTRIKIITSIPRTAIAEEEVEKLSLAPEIDLPAVPGRKKPVLVALDGVVVRDPFRISPASFPLEQELEATSEVPRKSGASMAETENHSEAWLTEKVAELAGQFRLQALIRGLPMAVINGRTYREGQLLDPVDSEQIRFRLIKVGDDSVILEHESIRHELRMSLPGMSQHLSRRGSTGVE